ncbi:UxaA family hydrolase [Profundibacter sp.]|uniref:UxaA family hydrolase n=1 Tax=Profundibacter sp. TaxID=3101071 RepID=UPI003D100A29
MTYLSGQDEGYTVNQLLRLHPEDNVLIALRALPAGTEAEGVRLQSAISLAHKVAAVPIAKGAPVLKYGMVIGRATADIEAGAHVHVHNMASQYTPTHYRKEEVA